MNFAPPFVCRPVFHKGGDLYVPAAHKPGIEGELSFSILIWTAGMKYLPK
jgi:hypothetical protein